MRTRVALVALLGLLAARSVAAIPMEEAAALLQEAEDVCQEDGGRLWGISLCGPLLLVDPQTRDVIANEPDREEQLHASGSAFLGKLPLTVNIANTALDWAGKKWTMLMLPLPEQRPARATLFAHEMWHRIQDQVGLPSRSPANAHLDSRDGRYLLQLEWRALAQALSSLIVAEQKSAVGDAAIFRARRHQLFPQAASEERALELHEGLAEYTGVRLSGSTDPRRDIVAHQLADAPTKPSFVRSFAYATGPAYGLLLDEARPRWRTELKPDSSDLAALLRDAHGISLPKDLAAAAQDRAAHYDGPRLAEAEKQREQARLAAVKKYRARLVTGDVLVLPLHKMQMQFDPQELTPLDESGTVYPTIRIVDVWGILEVTREGALLATDFSQVSVPAPTVTGGQTLKAAGWTLKLNPGWQAHPGPRAGSYELRPGNWER